MLNEKGLNAYDEHVQLFIDNHKNESHKNYSKKRMKYFEQDVHQKGYVFEQLFPCKRYEVLTKLLIKLSNTGITKISATTLAKKTKCSVRTITETVKAIKQTNQIIVARLKSTWKNNGHYIFVDKLHANYKAIMKEVFLLNDYEIAEQNAYQIAELKNAENVDISGQYDEKQCSKVIKGFKDFKNHFSNDLYTYSDVELKNLIEGLLTKYQKPKAMLRELYVVAKGIKNKFNSTLKESLLNSLIVKAMKTLFNSRYDNAYAYFSVTLTNMINNVLKSDNNKKLNNETTVTNIFEQQDKINKAKIAKGEKKDIPYWFKKNPTKNAPQMDYEAKRREIMKKLGI